MIVVEAGVICLSLLVASKHKIEPILLSSKIINLMGKMFVS
jgi:hypothetical protein